MGSKPQVAVLGLGGVGAFALRALARRGVRAVGLEQFELGHTRGSSHGGTRVFRHAYFEHPGYVPMLLASTEDFGRLERDLGVPLLERCGTLIAEPADGPVLRASREAARQHGLPVEELDAAAIRARWPALRPGPEHAGLFEPGGGFVRPEAAVAAALRDAVQHGAEVREGGAILDLEPLASSVRLHTEDGTLEVERVVLAAGPWTARLVPELRPRLRVTRQVQAWVEGGRDHGPSNLPCWFLCRAEGPALYGIPSDPRAEQPSWTKVALHGTTEVVDPAHAQPPPRPDELERLADAARAWLPASEAGFTAARTCLYTCTPDEQFLVGPAPGLPGVVLAAGLSGHGFKLTPALGEALADLATGHPCRFDLDFLAPDRAL
jgi:sarcosine oxidase